MRLLICVPMFLLACSVDSNDAASRSLISVAGQIEHLKLNEASGLARSNRLHNVYWSFNDDGPAVIYALDATGRHLGRVHISGAVNRDWEDIASFMLDGTAYLAIADIGDNDSRHPHLSLFVIAEPDPEDAEASLAWQVDFTYPGGPRDAESLAVDAIGGHAYVLSKRTVPAELYQLPLRPGNDDTVAAERVAVLDSLPQPSDAQLKYAMQNGWGWQPTAMDFAPDGMSALILTYDGINYFERREGQSWPEALQGRALHLPLGKYKNAESISYTDDPAVAILTLEGKHSPLLRVELLLQKNNM